jgi:hypothetical protein
MSSCIGEILGNYPNKHQLGEGGMNTIRWAVESRLICAVASKITCSGRPIPTGFGIIKMIEPDQRGS